MVHFSDAPMMELIIWGSTLAITIWTGFRSCRQFREAKSKAGNTKPGSTGPPFWTNLAMFGQTAGLFVPSLIYWTTTPYNKFQQQGWMTEYTLPSPPDVFGVDGVIIGRTAGVLGGIIGSLFSVAALKALGDQYHAIGIKEKPRVVDNGPFAYVRHPIFTALIIVAISHVLTYWSYIPLYALPVVISGCFLKVPIEEETLERDPVIGKKYKAYKLRVPYRIIPYIW